MVLVLRKSLPVSGSSARTCPQLTDEKYLSRHKRFELDEICTIYGLYIKKKTSHAAGSSARTCPQLTDEKYLSRHKRFELDEICTIYGLYIKKKTSHVPLIHAIVNAGGVTTGHAGRAFSPLPPAVFF